jgi:ABC-2 type transport system permease protein
MAAVFRGVWVIAYRELLRFVQERSRIVSSFAMPLLFLVIFGAGFNRIIGAITPGVDFIQFMYPGIIAMTVLMNSVMSGLSVVWDREFGFLKEVLVAPLSRGGIVLGKAAGAATVAVAQGFILLILSPLVGVSLNPLLVAKLVPILIILSLSLSGLGILVASRMRSQQGFQLMVQLIIFPLIFLSGIFFPVNNVPVWLEFLSKINPLTYGVDAIRQLFLTGGAVANAGDFVFGVTVFGHSMSIAEDIMIVAVFGVIVMLLAIWSFNRQE